MVTRFTFRGEINYKTISDFYEEIISKMESNDTVIINWINVEFQSPNTVKMLDLMFNEFINKNVRCVFERYKFNKKNMFYNIFEWSTVNQSIRKRGKDFILDDKEFKKRYIHPKILNQLELRHIRYNFSPFDLTESDIDSKIGTEIYLILDSHDIDKNVALDIGEVSAELVSNFVNHVSSNAILELVIADLVDDKSKACKGIYLTAIDFNKTNIISNMGKLDESGYFKEHFPKIDDILSKSKTKGIKDKNLLFSSFQKNVSSKDGNEGNKHGGSGLFNVMDLVKKHNKIIGSFVEINCKNISLNFPVEVLNENGDYFKVGITELDFVENMYFREHDISINNGSMISILFIVESEDK